MILNLFLGLCGTYGATFCFVYYLENMALYNYNCVEKQYLEIIQTHNYCTCQRLGTRVCNTWKKIRALDKQIKEQKKRYQRFGKWLNRLTFGLITHPTGF